MHPNRRTVARLALALPALALTRRVSLANGTVPGADWKPAAPQDFGFAPAAFEAVEAKLYPMPTTALMVVAAGRAIYTGCARTRLARWRECKLGARSDSLMLWRPAVG